jgi:ABC-type multidrug transport system ATPase subunit
MADKLAIEIKDLSKNYGNTTVVDRLNFHVRENEVFGLLGPNGAGKTTPGPWMFLALILPAHRGR